MVYWVYHIIYCSVLSLVSFIIINSTTINSSNLIDELDFILDSHMCLLKSFKCTTSKIYIYIIKEPKISPKSRVFKMMISLKNKAG